MGRRKYAKSSTLPALGMVQQSIVMLSTGSMVASWSWNSGLAARSLTVDHDLRALLAALWGWVNAHFKFQMLYFTQLASGSHSFKPLRFNFVMTVAR